MRKTLLLIGMGSVILLSSCSNQLAMDDGMGRGHIFRDVTDEGQEVFSQDVTDLPPSKPSSVIELDDGDSFDLVASPVAHEVDGKMVRMLAYNGSIPGPTLRVKQGSQITINFTNRVDVETLFHSHGLRLINRYDGTQLTQFPIEVGETYEYKIDFPDAGVYWYHPHIREDYTQESGMYGNYIVEPADGDYWSPVNRELNIVLDDLLLEDDQLASFYKRFGTHALIGRFGNVMITNGETDYQMGAKAGERVRLYLTNVANARTYHFTIPGLSLKLVGGDISKYEQEQFVEGVMLAPSERVVVEVLFPSPGKYLMRNVTPADDDVLGTFLVSELNPDPSYSDSFENLRDNEDVIADIDQYRQHFDRAPDKEIRLDIRMGGMDMGSHMMGGNMGRRMMQGGRRSEDWPADDMMPMMNERTTSEHITWRIIDEMTGRENMDIDWAFSKGSVVKIRITNDLNSHHPMQHPFHIHGQRFLVLDTNGVRNTNLVWKDTTLIKPGDAVDILVDMSNEGQWMAHCHVAEHLESGMMMGFSVVSDTVKPNGA